MRCTVQAPALVFVEAFASTGSILGVKPAKHVVERCSVAGDHAAITPSPTRCLL